MSSSLGTKIIFSSAFTSVLTRPTGFRAGFSISKRILAYNMSQLLKDYPWIQEPVIVSAPMRPFSEAKLAIAVTKAGGFGFIANAPSLREQLITSSEALPATETGTIPVGVGFQIFQDNLENAIKVVKEIVPAAVWLFAPSNDEELKKWAVALRGASMNRTKIWIQVGSIQDAVDAVEQCGTDVVLIAQGSDAGGHGLVKGSSIISLLPGIVDALKEAGHKSVPVLAAGGIVDSRGVAASVALGASGVVLGTRFLASKEAAIPEGFQKAILAATDGGQETVRTRLYDSLRGTDWPSEFDGRALINQSFLDDQGGMSLEENKKRFAETAKNPDNGYGFGGRLVTYSGSGVGLIKEVKGAADIVKELHHGPSNVDYEES